LRQRARWAIYLAIIIPVGILSRVVRTGSVLFDKYLGDALYAAMIYAILRLWWTSRAAAVWAAAILIAVESFQLTSIAARMLENEQFMVRLAARLMGTHFSYLDLLAYGVAIGCMYVVDSRWKL
jgi:hypothetical protein